jgi:hypothetical protein
VTATAVAATAPRKVTPSTITKRARLLPQAVTWIGGNLRSIENRKKAAEHRTVKQAVLKFLKMFRFSGSVAEETGLCEKCQGAGYAGISRV